MRDDNPASPTFHRTEGASPEHDAGASHPPAPSPPAVAGVTVEELRAGIHGRAALVAEAAPPFDAARWARTTRGLTVWFALLAFFGVGGLLIGQQELAALAAVSGLFVAAQAADLDPQWRMLHYMLAWVVPGCGVAAFVALGSMMLSAPVAGAWNGPLVAFCLVGAVASALTLFRPFTAALAARLFRHAPSTHTVRLAARMVFLCFLFALPGWFAVRRMFESLGDQIGSLIDSSTLGTGLIGYVLLAFASVGLLLARDRRQAFERLGIGPIGARQVLVIAIGVGILFALNGSADALQKRFFHALWIQDQRMSEAIGGSLSLAGTIALGLSAGIGEEITMRGALQPRLGVIGTALVFASLHVQYSWYGMIVIFVLGCLLGTIRNRTNTTVAMAVHALYDMAAVLSAGKPG
jgi:CAAX protease family protein